MAYSELIKKFDNIRDYMREFYVFGFKRREEYTKKSARSYDNERRRVESWLGDYMSFRQNESGKNVFLSVDSRTVSRNPLYKAFKAKSFTNNDIVLHFFILDILADGIARTKSDIVHKLEFDYYYEFEDAEMPNESTVRNKLKEYTNLGLLQTEKRGKEICFRISDCNINRRSWNNAIEFFSEAAPLGVIGSYMSNESSVFSFKHHYILNALDSQVMCGVLNAMSEKCCVTVTVFSKRRNDERVHTVYPMKLFISSQNGKQLLLAYHYKYKKPMFFRLENILNVKVGAVEKHSAKYEKYFEKLSENLWGTALHMEPSLDHIELTLHVEEKEHFIADRLNREKRCGTVEQLDANTLRFSADVYDANEMLPWIRTFIGRIEKLECSNSAVTAKFYSDLDEMKKLYGGDENAVQ